MNRAPRRRSGSTSSPSAGAAALAVAAACALLAPAACSRGADDPVLAHLGRALRRGERVLLVRALDPAGGSVAAVVDAPNGKPELRLYDRKRAGEYVLVHTEQQGDGFKNLAVDDLDGDGRDEILVTWEGGHLEMIQVLTRGADGAYRSMLQNAGRQIERHYDAAGRSEFWITSRTYDEGPGEAPAYATTVYRLSGDHYIEAPHR